uniref:Uncharacterized protein n=1 Tax=Echinococcus canadensis TaxID=519352 RepID=A0A915EXP7_9CEST
VEIKRTRKRKADDQSKPFECPHVSSQMESRNEENLKPLMSKSTSYFVAPPGFVHLRRAFPLGKGGDIEIIMIISSTTKKFNKKWHLAHCFSKYCEVKSYLICFLQNTLSQNKESSELYQALLGNETVAYKMSPITSTAKITNAEDILTFSPSDCLSISNYISGFQTSFCAPDVVPLPVLLVPTPVSPQSKASRQSETLGKSICFKTSSDMAKTVAYPLANSPAFNITEIHNTPVISLSLPCTLLWYWIWRHPLHGILETTHPRHHHGIGCDLTRFDLNREHPIRTLANMETFT